MGRTVSPDTAESACSGYTVDPDVFELAEVFSLLGVAAHVASGPPVEWRDGRDGALVCIRNGQAYAQVRRDGLLSSFSIEGESGKFSPRRGERVLHIEPVTAKDAAALTYNSLTARARRTVRHGVWQSLAINLCALTVPFFTMAVYDRVLGGSAVSSLPALLSGAVLVLAIMFVLRRVRSQMFASEFARFGASVSLALTHRLFRQPFLARDRLDSETAMARLRTGERTADLFASSNTVAIYDAPFILLTLIALVMVGGVLAVIPALYLAIFLFIGVVLGWTRSATNPVHSGLAQEHRAMVSDLPYAESIRTKGLSKPWLDRFDQLSRASARATHAAQQRPALVQSIGTSLGTGTALVTLVVGLDLALQGRLSPGTLIGTMLLTWRITGPAQGLFLAMPRLRALHEAWGQLKALLNMPVVHSAGHAQDLAPTSSVDIKAEGLFMRYASGADPAVTGVSFDLPAGSVVAVIGPNGCGKSTLLRLLSGTLETQSGRLMIGGRSMSHFSPDSLAERIAYLPSDPRECVNSADLPAEATSIDEVAAEERAWRLTTSRDAPIYVLDDPLAVSGPEARAEISDFTESKKGRATVVIATHDTDLVQLADIALVMDHGTLVYAGPVAAPESTADAGTETAEEITS
ncbi:ATP-binding cassette domain-containing protein [Tropicibacter sp. Alg240-R139]|uniref:ATP-binding cassette domain-containing protein n=1 Tax=Tropicibacter sp. Alg240-R139 TaxID=2305991 RepID=UPI0013DFFDB7|nr:ATP-binding cassette domain-containing protein [Tropicibacter sp. Alg240-R139]